MTKEMISRFLFAKARLHLAREENASLRARIAALEAQLAARTGAVKVKALGDWRRGYCDDEVTIEQVSTGFGSIYQVRIFEGTIWLDYPVREKEAFPTVEAAKAAAQADYERRILSALEPAPEAQQERPAEQAVTEAMELARAVLAQSITAGHNVPGPTPEDIEKAFWALDAALKAAMEAGR